MSHEPKKILIILLGAIGDVVRGLPVAVRIKRAWPDAEITWAVEPISKGLVSEHPAIDKVIVFDRPRGLPAYLRFIKELRKEKFDLVLDMQRHLKSGFSSLATGAKRRIGFHRKNSRELNWLFNTESSEPAEHFSSKTEQFQLFGDALGLAKLSPLEFGFEVSEEKKEALEKLMQEAARARGLELPESGKRAVLILGSTWESRFWFPERYRETIIGLKKNYGIVSILIGAKGEREFADQILANDPNLPAIDLVGKTSISDLITLFSLVTCAIGSDSGPMHIAAAMKKPVISLWGATSPKRSAPYGSEDLVLQSAIGCSPCYKHTCPVLNRLCMYDIPAEAVLARVDTVINEIG